MAWQVEPGGGAIPNVHRGEAGEEGKLVVGSHRLAEQVGNYQDGALEARAAWPRRVAGLQYLFPLSGFPVCGENTADVGILRPGGYRPRVAGEVAKGYYISPTSSLSMRPSSGWSHTWISFGGFLAGEPCPKGSHP